MVLCCALPSTVSGGRANNRRDTLHLRDPTHIQHAGLEPSSASESKRPTEQRAERKRASLTCRVEFNGINMATSFGFPYLFRPVTDKYTSKNVVRRARREEGGVSGLLARSSLRPITLLVNSCLPPPRISGAEAKFNAVLHFPVLYAFDIYMLARHSHHVVKGGTYSLPSGESGTSFFNTVYSKHCAMSVLL